MRLIESITIVLLASAGPTTNWTHIDFSVTICEFKI